MSNLHLSTTFLFLIHLFISKSVVFCINIQKFIKYFYYIIKLLLIRYESDQSQIVACVLSEEHTKKHQDIIKTIIAFIRIIKTEDNSA